MKVYCTTPEYELAYQDLLALMGRHKDSVAPVEMLAIAANVVGKLMAVQDKRKYTSEQVTQVVTENIEEGNRQAIETILFESPSKGTA